MSEENTKVTTDDEMFAEDGDMTPSDLAGIIGDDDFSSGFDDGDIPMPEPQEEMANLRDIIEAEEPEPNIPEEVMMQAMQEQNNVPEREITEEIKGGVNSWLTGILEQPNPEDDLLMQGALKTEFFDKVNHSFAMSAQEHEAQREAIHPNTTEEQRDQIVEKQKNDWQERRRRRIQEREENRRKAERERLGQMYEENKRREEQEKAAEREANKVKDFKPTPQPVTAPASEKPVEEEKKEEKPVEAQQEKEEEKSKEKKVETSTTLREFKEVPKPKTPANNKKKYGKKGASSANGADTETPLAKKLVIVAIVIALISTFVGVKANSGWCALYGNVPQQVIRIGGKVVEQEAQEEPSLFNCLIEGLSAPTCMSPFSAGTFFSAFALTFVIGAAVYFFIWSEEDLRKRTRDGHEHGKARLATPSDFKKYREKFMENSDYNMLFSQRIGLSLDNKKTNRSANVLVIGGTGTGKTFRYIKPNILQENSSQIITDPSGDLFRSFAPYLIKKGYNVYLFNVSDMEMSNHYNPLLNVYDADGNIDSQKVDVLVDLYMKNASAGKENGGGDPFWEKSEKAFLTGVIFYVLENDAIKREEKCFNTVLKYVQMARADESKKDAETMLTKEIKKWQKQMEEEGRPIKCPLYYDTFLIAPQKTANTILITTAVDLQIFSNEHVDRITRWNSKYPDININLDDIGSTQSYVFLGIPQSHQAYNFLIAMLYSQLYSRLYDLGERGFVNKWLIEETTGIPKFNPFDSEEDAIAFRKDCARWNTSEDTGRINLFAVDYINKQKMYRIRWNGLHGMSKQERQEYTGLSDEYYKNQPEEWQEGSIYKLNKGVFKKSFMQDRLEELIVNCPNMSIRCNSEAPQLPIHVNFLLDEFKNIGEIPNFLTILSTSRKYRIGSHAIIQDIAQIKTMYPDDEHQTLLANVDTTIFLGSILTDDKEAVQKMMGKTTIKQRSVSNSKSGNSITWTPTEVDLMSIDEIGKINEGKRNDCIVIVRDVTPFVDKKLNLLEHKRWKDVCACKGFDPTVYYLNNKENKLYESVI